MTCHTCLDSWTCPQYDVLIDNTVNLTVIRLSAIDRMGSDFQQLDTCQTFHSPAFFLAHEEYRDCESGERRLSSIRSFLSKLDRFGAWSRRFEKRGRSLGTFDDHMSNGSDNGGLPTCPVL